VIKNQKGQSNHIIEITDDSGPYRDLIFSENPNDLNLARIGTATLSQLGYTAVTGSTVWNLHKENLTNQPEENVVPLLYARNIHEGGIVLRADERRPQYIKGAREFVGKAIVANRIIGTVGKGSLRAALVPEKFIFAAENHLNVIQANPSKKQLVSYEELFQIVTSQQVIKAAIKITGNTQLSATEWNHVLPLPVKSDLDLSANMDLSLF
jgi:hypothetical protein